MIETAPEEGFGFQLGADVMSVFLDGRFLSLENHSFLKFGLVKFIVDGQSNLHTNLSDKWKC